MKDTHTSETTIKRILQNRRRWLIMLYDALIIFAVNCFMIGLSPSNASGFTLIELVSHFACMAVCVFVCRHIARVYNQVWRYGGSAAYIHMIIADTSAGVVYFVLQAVLPIRSIEFIRAFSSSAMVLLLSMSIRLLYQYLYAKVKRLSQKGGFLWKVLYYVSASSISESSSLEHSKNNTTRIKIAIVGAGNVGALLADELIKNPQAAYIPCCFIDIDRYKIGREIMGIPVLSSDEATKERLEMLGIREIVFALPNMDAEKRRDLYEFYNRFGCKIKTYDFPMIQTAENGKRHMREFDIEELLFRQPIEIHNQTTGAYYRDKVVLITGGGGSIGSELCRQIAKMHPNQLIILDICENGAYDVQQELRIAYGNAIDLRIEIVSVCDRIGLETVFRQYHPDIVIHAAAHKHVPLMEHNCCEAVKNNVFGTLNTVGLCEKYKVSRFMMVSTDKAVNPTNVMGATKRMCEMIVQTHSTMGADTVFSATRFGNVLGSAGSVIPLFKKQIMHGGPVTVTDKRIIRYFMTIPEASQLVLESGAMARNGELFVLNMGSPVKILDLAENMIRLSGFEPYRDIDIVETGLRPGEKLYEELLIKTEELDKTSNKLIFIERDEPVSCIELEEKLAILRTALLSENNDKVKEALMEAVPTFYKPEAVNFTASQAEEMQLVSGNDRKLVKA